MERNINTTKTIKEKNIVLLFIVLFGLLLISTYANAQSIVSKTTFSPEEIETHIVKDFNAKQIDGVIYFKFLILENRDNNTKYILESSNNGENFSPVMTKIGAPSPNNIPLLYCYKVNALNNPNSIFRVKIESEENTDYSKTLYINLPTNELTASKITN